MQRLIKIDEKLRPVFPTGSTVHMFTMNKIISKHVKSKQDVVEGAHTTSSGLNLDEVVEEEEEEADLGAGEQESGQSSPRANGSSSLQPSYAIHYGDDSESD